MKKEYAKPSVSITEIDYAGMLCASDSPFIETTDTDEIDVGEGEWDGKTIL